MPEATPAGPVTTAAGRSFDSDAELIEALRVVEWATISMTQQGPDGQPVETEFKMQVCPYCQTPMALDSGAYTFREWHVNYHEETLARIASAHRGVMGFFG